MKSAKINRNGKQPGQLQENGINIQIPPHILGAMEAIEGIKISSGSYEETELVGL